MYIGGKGEGYTTAQIDPTNLGRSKAIDIPNFDQTSQSTADFRFLKTNGRHIENLLSVSVLTYSLSSACDSALAYQILCKSHDRRQSYDIILILQHGGPSVANLLPVSDLATSDM